MCEFVQVQEKKRILDTLNAEPHDMGVLGNGKILLTTEHLPCPIT